jgi:subtilisin family serine protease
MAILCSFVTTSAGQTADTFDGNKWSVSENKNESVSSEKSYASQWNTFEKSEYVPDEIIVKFKNRATTTIYQGLTGSSAHQMNSVSSGIDKTNSKFKLKKIAPLFHNARSENAKIQKIQSSGAVALSEFEKKIKQRMKRAPIGSKMPSMENIFTIAFNLSDDQSIDEVINEYRNDPNVEYVQKKKKYVLNLQTNDPMFSDQWSLNNNGQSYRTPSGYERGTPDVDIDAPEGWDKTTGSDNVVVAVIDCGVDYTHPDIRDNMWINTAEANGVTGVDDDHNGFVDDIRGYDVSDNDGDPMDVSGHGTHVAGTIAARGNNGIGISGVCWRTKIMAVKIFDNAYDDVIVRGIKYAADNGADVLNNSWGSNGRDPSNPLLEDAIDYAVALGCIPVFAAGNNNDDVAYYSPSNYNKVISVAATDANGQKAYFSNYGANDLAAPGVDILSLAPGGGIQLMSGTSMACPHVAGACALLLSANPNLTLSQIRNILRGSGDAAPDGLTISNRILNINHALTMLTTGNLAPTVIAGSNQNIVWPQTTLNLNGSVTDDGIPSNGTLSYHWSLGNGPAPVTFSNANILNPVVTFTTSGKYMLKLEASDGDLVSFDQFLVDVTMTHSVGHLSINGKKMILDGTNLFIANGNSITKVNVQNSYNPVDAGSIQNSMWNIINLTVAGDLIYAADSARQLIIINKNTLQPVTTMNVPDIFDVDVVDNYAYIAAGQNGLQVIDISNTNLPVLVGSFNQFVPSRVAKSVVCNGLVACLAGDGYAVLVPVYNKSKIYTYVEMFAPSYIFTNRIPDMTISGDYLYIASKSLFVCKFVDGNYIPKAIFERDKGCTIAALNGSSTLALYTPSTILDTKGIGIYDIHKLESTNGIGYYSFWQSVSEMKMSNNAIYILNNMGLEILENPLPNIAPSISVPSLSHGSISGCSVSATMSDDGAPANSVLTSRWSLFDGPSNATFSNDTWLTTNVNGCVPGDYMFTLTASDGDKETNELTWVNVSKYLNKNSMSYTTMIPGDSYYDRAVKQNGYLFIMHRNNLDIFNTAHPSNPVLESSFVNGTDYLMDFYVEGNYIYTAGDKGFTIIDISNKSNPVEIARRDDVQGCNQAKAVTVAGNYAYVVYYGNTVGSLDGLYVIDISNKTNPQVLNFYREIVGSEKIIESNGYLYTSSNAGFDIFSLENPETPTFLSNLDVGYFKGLSVFGNYVYAVIYNVLRIFDVTDKFHPFIAGQQIYPIMDNGMRRSCGVFGQYLFISGGQYGDGLNIWNIADKANPVHVDEYKSDAHTSFVYEPGRVTFLDNGRISLLTAQLPNTAPSAFAGIYKTIYGNVLLKGQVSDDGFPSGNTSVLWSRVSGPGTVTFTNAQQLSTTASFSVPGIYVLRLTANDGELSSYNDVQLTVNPSLLPIVSATASSIESNTYAAINSIDGNSTTTRWGSIYNSDPQWIVYDLGTPQSVTSIVIDWESANAKNYVVEGSNDPTFARKTLLATKTNMAAINHRIDSIPGLTGTYRYYRIYGTVRNGTWGYSIWETRFYSGTSIGYYTLTTNATNGTITNSPSGSTFASGTVVTLTATPAANYHFVSWSGDATGTTNPTTIIMNSNKSVSATFAINTCTVTSSAGPNGSITPLGDRTVNYGANPCYTITPSTGYEINQILVDGISVTPVSTQYCMTAVTSNRTISVTFKPVSELIKETVASVTASSTETGHPPTDATDGNATTTRWSSAYSDPQWIVFDLGTAKSIVSVVFDWESANAKNYLLEGSNDATFTTKTTLATRTNMAAVNHRIDSIPNLTGSYRYYRMYGTARNGSWGYSIWEARFYSNGIPVNYTLATSTVGRGGISLSPESGVYPAVYPAGTVVTLNAVAGRDFGFSHWSGDATGTNNQITITMNSNKNVTANFTLLTYTITATAGANGTITPSGVSTVSPMANITYTIAPNTGYTVDNVIVDGVAQGAITTYSFNNVSANHTISASFRSTAGPQLEAVAGDSVSSEENDNGTIRKASYSYDGNVNTRWSSQYSDPQWIIYDMGSPKSITSIVIDWEGANAKNYIIEGSNDKSFITSKTRLASFDNMPATNHRIDRALNLTGSFRYYRIWCNQRNGSWGYSIWETRFYTGGNGN